MNKIISKLFLITIISCFSSGQAFAIYKHKVIVTKFDDPQDWNESYHPGKILSQHLHQHLIDEGRFHMLETSLNENMPGSVIMNESNGRMEEKSEIKESFDRKSDMGKFRNMSEPDNMTGFKPDKYNKTGGNIKKSYSSKTEGFNADYQSLRDVEPAIRYISDDSFAEILSVQDSMINDMNKMPAKAPMIHDPVPWPVRLGRMPEKASLFEIRGMVVKFDPGNMNVAIMDKGKTSTTEKAELEVMLQLIQNKTGRVVYKQKFRAFSNSGRRPFSKDLDISQSRRVDLESSSMSLAFSFLTKEIVSFINNTIFRDPLEGEIIAIKKEDVLINIGRQNGVQVGDKFRVHSIGLQLDDPLTEFDLGDIYVKMGAIQVLESMLGFSRARIIVGKDFMPGNMVRSFKQFKDSSQQFSAGEELSESEDPVPWWSFNDIKSFP